MVIKKNIPQLRFPDFDGEWFLNTLGEIANFSKGKGLSKNDIAENGATECIRYGELYTTYDETIDTVFSKTNINPEDLVLSEANDIIIPASGETEIDIAKASCVLKSGVAIGGDLNIIKTSNNGVFLSYYLNSKKKIDIAKLAQGISVVHLYAGQLSKLQLKIPSLPEQQKIASFFTAIDQKITQLKRKLTLLEQYKKGVMQLIFSQEIRFKDDNGQEFPKWEKKKIKELFRVTRGNVLAATKVKENKDEPFVYPVYSSQTTRKGLLGYYNDYLFEDCITWTTDGANAGDVNYRKGKFYCTNVCGVLESKEGFANLCISEILNLEARKHVSYVGNPKLMNNVMAEIKIIVPTAIREQTRIANFLSAIDDKINHTQTQIEKVEHWKKGLLQKMFV